MDKVLGTAPMLLFVMDRAGNMTFLEAQRQVLGIDPLLSAGKPVDECFEQAPEIVERLRSARARLAVVQLFGAAGTAATGGGGGAVVEPALAGAGRETVDFPLAAGVPSTVAVRLIISSPPPGTTPWIRSKNEPAAVFKGLSDTVSRTRGLCSESSIQPSASVKARSIRRPCIAATTSIAPWRKTAMRSASSTSTQNCGSPGSLASQRACRATVAVARSR